MANLRETSVWEAGIYQLETSDPVMGGENGIDNRASRQLANRTLWLKNELARQIELINNSKLSKTENAVSASKFSTARSITMTGDGSWNVNFDGSQNATGTMTLANSGVRAGSYNSVTVDAKGRVTAGLTQTHGLVTATTATGTTNAATTNSNTFLNIVTSGVGQTASIGSSTKIIGISGLSVSSDTTGSLMISGVRATDTQIGVTQLSHETNGHNRTKAASEYALGEVRRLANQAQVTADGIALTWNNVQNKPATFTPSAHRHNWSEIDSKPTSVQGYGITNALRTDTDSTTTGIISINRADSYIKGEQRGQMTWYVGSGSSSSNDVQLVSQSHNTKLELKNNRIEVNKPLYVGSHQVFHEGNLPTWSQVTAKPSTFTPSSHRHAWGEIDSKPTTLSGYGITDGVNKAGDTMTGPLSIHTSQDQMIKGRKGQTDIFYIGTPTSSENLTLYHHVYQTQFTLGRRGIYSNKDIFINDRKVFHEGNLPTWSQVTGKPSTFTPSSHRHAWGEIDSKPTTLSGYGITDGVGKTGNETIQGVKTFGSSPKAPTPATTSNDTTVATTAFVKALASGRLSTATAGYQVLPSGLIIQWGSQSNDSPVTFPIAFPNSVLSVNLTLKVNSRDNDNAEAFGVHSVTSRGFSIFNWVIPYQGCYWIAIGH